MADPSRDNTTYTWDPVSASWVHERGAKGSTPPVPPDVHALQTYFWDPDSRRWIRTLLGPLGQQLAAKWPGAHREPDIVLGSDDADRLAAISSTPPKKSSNPLPIVLVGVALLGSVGGAAMFASQQGQSSSPPFVIGDHTPTPSGVVTTAPTAAPSASPSPSESPSTEPQPSTPTKTQAPPQRTAPPRTPAPTPQPTITLPPGIGRATLPDGSTFVYTGPTLALRGQQLLTTFTAVQANGRPVNGSVTIILGDSRGSTQVIAPITNGGIAASLTATPPSGQYPLSILYNGQLAQVVLITIR